MIEISRDDDYSSDPNKLIRIAKEYNKLAKDTNERTSVKDFGLGLLGNMSDFAGCRLIIAPNKKNLGYINEPDSNLDIDIEGWENNTAREINEDLDLLELYRSNMKELDGFYNLLVTPDRRGEITCIEHDERGFWDPYIEEMVWFKPNSQYQNSIEGIIDFLVDVDDLEDRDLENIVVHEFIISKEVHDKFPVRLEDPRQLNLFQ